MPEGNEVTDGADDAAPVRRFRAAVENVKNRLRCSDRVARHLAAAVVALSAGSAPVAAQSAAGEAAGAAEQAGLCRIITLAFGFIVLVLILVSGGRGGMAWRNLGAAAPDKKKKGREQLMGAGITFCGVLFFSVFGYALQTAGLAGIGCVNWSGIVPGILLF